VDGLIPYPGNHTLKTPTIRSFGLYPAINSPGHSISFTDFINISIADEYIIYTNTPALATQNITFHAIEIMWYWCAKAFSLKVTGNVPQWNELARSADVINNTARSFQMLGSLQLGLCAYGLSTSCDQSQWGKLILAPPPGFASHPNLVMDEVTGVAASVVLHSSFWDGVSVPLSSPNETGDGGRMAMVRNKLFYRVQGDISLALSYILWPNAYGLADAAMQFRGLANIASNIAKSMEN
jgi:hypothetical protein